MNNRVRFAVFLYFIIILSVYSFQPKLMFTTDRKMKPFGLHSEASLLPFPLFIIWTAVGAYYIPCILCVFYKCSVKKNMK